jgi:hypothetical protein
MTALHHSWLCRATWLLNMHNNTCGGHGLLYETQCARGCPEVSKTGLLLRQACCQAWTFHDRSGPEWEDSKIVPATQSACCHCRAHSLTESHSVAVGDSLAPGAASSGQSVQTAAGHAHCTALIEPEPSQASHRASKADNFA